MPQVALSHLVRRTTNQRRPEWLLGATTITLHCERTRTDRPLMPIGDVDFGRLRSS
jgi:hypothetical protein